MDYLCARHNPRDCITAGKTRSCSGTVRVGMEEEQSPLLEQTVPKSASVQGSPPWDPFSFVEIFLTVLS